MGTFGPFVAPSAALRGPRRQLRAQHLSALRRRGIAGAAHGLILPVLETSGVICDAGVSSLSPSLGSSPEDNPGRPDSSSKVAI